MWIATYSVDCTERARKIERLSAGVAFVDMFSAVREVDNESLVILYFALQLFDLGQSLTDHAYYRGKPALGR